MNQEKAKFYKTAYAVIGCYHFKAGECVAVKWFRHDEKGINWFIINASEHGPLPYDVTYPEHHLTRFCL